MKKVLLVVIYVVILIVALRGITDPDAQRRRDISPKPAQRGRKIF